MTTYSYNLSLDDSEAIALTNALRCYLSPEVQTLIAENPGVGLYGNTKLIRKILEDKLQSSVELASTNSSHQFRNG